MLFIEPGDEVYGGMVVGLHAKDNDLDVNVCRAKKLTNIRSSTSDIAVKLVPPLAAEPGAQPLADRRRRTGRGDAEDHPHPQDPN